MQQDTKLSRFMFHLKFSSTEGYVNDHELYEVIRSRNLHQNQFGVKMNLKKQMRNIQIAEKAERYGFENNRKLFVQKMRERREQADKQRLETTSMKPKGDQRDKNKVKRLYVPIPQSTTIYSEFPAIVQIQQANSPDVSVLLKKPRDRVPPKLLLPVPATSSVIAAKRCTENLEHRQEYVSSMKNVCEDVETASASPLKAVIASRGKPNTVTQTPGVKEKSGQLFPAIPGFKQKIDIDSEHVEQSNESYEGLSQHQEDFVKKLKRGRGKLHVSTSRLTDAHSDDQGLKTSQCHKRSTEKFEQWRDNITLSDVNGDRLLDAVDLRYRVIQKLAKELYDARQSDQTNENRDSKGNNYLSLPELEAAPKPMVTMDPGGTTPDGRLILTKTDYEDYLSGYRRARDYRLRKARKYEQDVKKKVDGFKIGQSLRLREPSRLLNPLVLRAL